LVDWRTVNETGVQQEDGEDLEEPSPRIKEEWLSKSDNVWDTRDKNGRKARLIAPRKEQTVGKCGLEHHLKVSGEMCGVLAFMEKLMRPYWTDAAAPERLQKLLSAYECPLKGKEGEALG
jgi:hypothetical protein